MLISVGNLLVVHSSCPELHDITLLFKWYFKVCPEGIVGFGVGGAQHVHPPPVVLGVCVGISKSILCSHMLF